MLHTCCRMRLRVMLEGIHLPPLCRKAVLNGPVVQLVRMPPCHGGGRGFESRPVREKAQPNRWGFFILFREDESTFMHEKQRRCRNSPPDRMRQFRQSRAHGTKLRVLPNDVSNQPRERRVRPGSSMKGSRRLASPR